jgi:hypothetical protein
MDAYHRSEQFARYQFELSGLLARPSEMTIYSVTDAVRPVPSGPARPAGAVAGATLEVSLAAPLDETRAPARDLKALGRQDRHVDALGGIRRDLAGQVDRRNETVVDLCTCFGEPVDQLRSNDPELLRDRADRPARTRTVGHQQVAPAVTARDNPAG